MKGSMKLPKFEIEEPFFIRNLLIFPMIGGNGFGGDVLTIEEATERALLDIVETKEVESAHLRYRGKEPVYLVDGEEIVGALQNRILNTSIYIENPVDAKIPVTCAEERRWGGTDSAFRAGAVTAFPSLRAILAKSVTRSLETTGKFKSDQQKVWDTIERSLNTLRVRSVTSSMHDLYITLSSEIDHYINEFFYGIDSEFSDGKNGGFCGFLAYCGERFLGMELFPSARFFNKFREKLLKGYVLEAMSLSNIQTSLIDRKRAKRWIDNVLDRDFRRFNGVIEGTEFRYIGRKNVAKALFHKDSLIHLSAFSLA